jgi:salicylate synthase
MQYHEVSIERPADPLTLLRHLAAELPQPQIVYERAGVWSFACGVMGEVLLNGRHLVHAWGGTRRSTRLSGRPLADVARALAGFPLSGWTAHGWVAFEYAYLRAGLPVPDGTLLHLSVPTVQVKINSYVCVIRSVDRRLAEHLRDLLGDLGDLGEVEEIWSSRSPSRVGVEAADPGSYRQMVAAAVQEIRRGDLQKVILSRRVPIPFPVDLLATYAVGRAASRPARSFLLDTPQLRAVGFSPETVLTARPDGRIRSNPLAGTRALVGDDQDAARTATLRTDPKEIFEHAIAVKLAFEEFHRICAPRSTVIDDYMTIKHHGSVQHLGSQVSGRLPAHRTCWDALEAVFPAVTASGIPKTAAFDCITRLESEPRGLYAGAVLTAGHDGALDAAVALRTLFVRNGAAWLQAGAGIVATSDPRREYEETCEKLRSVAPYVVAEQPATVATTPAGAPAADRTADHEAGPR